jgi:NADP-dependent 3-hydroxy acid dehydrogenase YdfG
MLPDDARVVVTGASSGIGLAVAAGLARRGARLWAAARRPVAIREGLDKTVPGVRVDVFGADFGNAADLECWIARLREALTGVDLLVHAAGMFEPGSVDSAATELFERQFRVNVLAPYRLTQALLPLLEAVSGQVVFINSTGGLSAAPGVSQYAATKHALRALADGLRAEVNSRGIRVLSVFPGRTATPMQAGIFAWEGKPWRPECLLQPEDVAAVVLAAVSLPRTAEVTDLRVRPMRKQ